MQITNSLEEKSFAYSAEKETMDARRDEIGRLMEIVSYCQEDEVGEPVRYHDTLWEICVQEGVTFTGWLFNREGAGSADDRRRLLDALSKNVMIPMDETPDTEKGLTGVKAGSEENTADQKTIRVALGEFPSCVSDREAYVRARRKILSGIRNVTEYEAFMHSCFIDSCFAEGMLSEMKHIRDFPDRTEEITKALGVLNDHAVELYRQYSGHLEEAMNRLSVLLHRECAPDPAHADRLIFPFVYSEQLEDKTVAAIKDIECSPHLKLMHSGSNLRIYFYWCDDKIGGGEKVLVGRIGRHPYKKS